jgi:hypothetical protein
MVGPARLPEDVKQKIDGLRASIEASFGAAMPTPARAEGPVPDASTGCARPPRHRRRCVRQRLHDHFRTTTPPPTCLRQDCTQRGQLLNTDQPGSSCSVLALEEELDSLLGNRSTQHYAVMDTRPATAR